jgi:pimeloyl-ACP methyl ester carboxylesterase/DNA-binding winged helix-turn-helix (wHTH) protein
VRYRFGDYELDLDRRELRHSGREQPLQPQVLSLLAYLIANRARVVSKRELLDTIWADAVVTDASLQRAVSLLRSALRDAGDPIRTYPRQGYRFVLEVVEQSELPADVQVPSTPERFRPRYAVSGDAHIAYCTSGAGDTDVVLVLGWACPMRSFLELREGAALCTALAKLGRVVLFDKRGTGLSDRVKALPALSQRVDDLRAVLDEVGSRRAVLIGFSEGGPLSIAFAHAEPSRVAGLVLVGAFARMANASDYAHGWPQSRVGELKAYVRHRWGDGHTLLRLAPEGERGPTLAAWASGAEQAGASPGAAFDLLEMNLQIDVRPMLGELAVPAVVLHAREDPVISIESGRYLADHIPAARYVELEGSDHICLFQQMPRLLSEIARLVAGR